MLQNAYFLAKIGADTAENEQHFAEFLPKIGNYTTGPQGLDDRPRKVAPSPPARGSSRSGFYSNILANVRCFLPIASRWGNLRVLLESVFKRSTKLVYVGISQNLPAKSA